MHTDDLAVDLAQLRHPRAMPASAQELELELAIVRVEGARREVRAASTKDDEKLAHFHLKMATGHLAKVIKLHPGLPTWKPPKAAKAAKKKKSTKLVPPKPHESQLVYQRSEYRGRSERRFVDEFRPGQEHRGYSGRQLEVRDLTGGPGTLVTVTGQPIVYNQPYRVADKLGEFEETMKPGVASHLLDSCDCRFLFGHDGIPMARSSAGTLKLKDTSSALRFTATVDTRQRTAQDLVIAIERGDVSQMSVGFVVAQDSWDTGYTKREVTRFRSLEDVSAVAYAASPSTSIAVASAGSR